MKKIRIFLQKIWRRIDPFWIMTKKIFQLVWGKIDFFWILMILFFLAFVFMAHHP
jgi:hypothetical protein